MTKDEFYPFGMDKFMKSEKALSWGKDIDSLKVNPYFGIKSTIELKREMFKNFTVTSNTVGFVISGYGTKRIYNGYTQEEAFNLFANTIISERRENYYD